MSADLWGWALLGGAAFAAGLVDAVVGGGGLIQVPVLLEHFSQTSIPTLFGTNKVSSIAGTSSAMVRYGRAVRIPWRVVLPATLTALAGSWSGAALASLLPRAWMQPLVLALMILVAVYTFMKKDFGHAETRPLRPSDRWRAMVLGLAIGCYDGFFGPGTGSFLMFAFVRLFGMDFLRATASAKVINATTNLAAIAFFASHGPVLWPVGIGMALCNMLGGHTGARLALRHGTAFVRRAFILIVVVLIAKLAWQMLEPLL